MKKVISYPSVFDVLFRDGAKSLSSFSRIAVFAALTISVGAGHAWAQNGEVEEVVIEAEYIPDEKLATADISEVLDVSDMSITGDSNVGDALKRLPGLSLVGGKFIYIRGLGERYSSTYFNGTPMPGLDPLSRAVPLDLFDTNVIANTLVQKTYSAEYSAEFTGGAVDIRSAAVPNESSFEIKIKAGSNSISTGKSQLTYNGGGRDWTGFDDGSRDLPGLVSQNLNLYPRNIVSTGGGLLTAEQADSIRYSFSNKNNVWDVRESGDNPIDQGFSTALKQRWDPSDNLSFGVLATLSYDQKWRNRYERRLRASGSAPALSFTELESIPGAVEVAQGLSEENLIDEVLRFDGFVDAGPLFFDQDDNGEGDIDQLISKIGASSVRDYERSVREIGLNSLLALGVDINNTHELKLTKMLLRNTSDEASLERQRRNNTPDQLIEFARLQWIENQIDFTQIAGLHILDSAEISWRYSNVEGSRDSPDTRVHGRARTRGDTDFTLLTNNRSDLAPSRNYEFLDDTAEEYGIDFKLPFTSDRGFVSDFEWRFGYSGFKKRRSFDSYRFSYGLGGIDPQLADPDELLVGDLSVLLDASTCEAGGDSDPTDECYLAESASAGGDGISMSAGFGSALSAFSGQLINEAFYMNFDFGVLESLRFNVGVRKERFEIDGSARGDINESSFIAPAGVSVEEALRPTVSSSGIYPTAKATWQFYSNMQLRASYSETQNRPTLRELIFVQVFNPDDGQLYIGNPTLEISDITSYDLRYEWYFADKDYLSITSFKKQIDNPIELNEQNRVEGQQEFTWDNEDSATNEGVEFEIRKYFGEYISIIGNASRISSRLKIAGETVNGDQTTRPLQGVSENLYNAQIVYKNETSSLSLAWNYFSERITILVSNGDNRNKTTVLEQPRHALDFNAKHKFYIDDVEYSVGFKATNLLDENFEEQYYTGLFYDGYERGTSYTLSLGAKF